MFDHIVATLHQLMSKYPSSGVVLGGDKNEFNISPIISMVSKMRQIVTLPTKGKKILSVIVTNMSHLYATPIICPPVDPDIPNHSPSDHNVPVTYPVTNFSPASRVYTSRTFRPLPQSGFQEFGGWITKHKWADFSSLASVNDQVESLQQTLCDKVDEVFPQKNL